MDRSPQEPYATRAAVFKALGHPVRLLMVDALAKGELCVCDLTRLAGLDVSTVSKHLAVLREAAVVDSRKEGANVFYRLTLSCVPGFISCVDAHIKQAALAQMALLA